ncbi:MAG: Spy/CpxP family protein refolding chaperone [Syntrophaceae bacterium]
MKKTIIILSALFLLIQGNVSTVHAGRGLTDEKMVRPCSGPYNVDLTASSELNLTAEQIARIRTIEEKYNRDMEPLCKQLLHKRRELKLEWLQASPDYDRITVLQGEVAKLHGQIRENMACHRMKVLDVLTSEQRALIVETAHMFDFHHKRGRFWPTGNIGEKR